MLRRERRRLAFVHFSVLSFIAKLMEQSIGETEERDLIDLLFLAAFIVSRGCTGTGNYVIPFDSSNL